MGKTKYVIPPGAPICGPRKGTFAGAQAHVIAGEKPCPECSRGRAEQVRAYRAAAGTVKNSMVSHSLLAELLAAAPEPVREKAIAELGLPLLRILDAATASGEVAR